MVDAAAGAEDGTVARWDQVQGGTSSGLSGRRLDRQSAMSRPTNSETPLTEGSQTGEAASRRSESRPVRRSFTGRFTKDQVARELRSIREEVRTERNRLSRVRDVILSG